MFGLKPWRLFCETIYFFLRATVRPRICLFANMRSGVFFEREGLLNHVMVERKQQTSPRTLREFQINEGAIGPLKTLKGAGFILIATSNQPGLSRGSLSRTEMDRMHDLLKATFELDDVLVCPHDETDRCPCRKPKPGLLIEAAFKWHLDLDRSFVVSQKWQDADAARLVGCTSLLLKSPWNGPGHRDFLLDTLDGIVRKILQLAPFQHQGNCWCSGAI